eukprot:GSMAST32.ASY1.ANO1.2557.1 assembled CDS
MFYFFSNSNIFFYKNIVPNKFKFFYFEIFFQNTLEAARDAKETVCCCRAENVPPMGSSFTLPDGTQIQLTAEETTSIPEMLFKSDMIESLGILEGSVPLQHLLHNTVSSCDPEIRSELLRSIIIAGGGALLPNLHRRVASELRLLLPSSYRVSIVTPGNLGRKFAPFIGGSILSSLGSFHQCWVSKQEYDEHGASIVNTKCH